MYKIVALIVGIGVTFGIVRGILFLAIKLNDWLNPNE
jgi:hypothetical protein